MLYFKLNLVQNNDYNQNSALDCSNMRQDYNKAYQIYLVLRHGTTGAKYGSNTKHLHEGRYYLTDECSSPN